MSGYVWIHVRALHRAVFFIRERLNTARDVLHTLSCSVIWPVLGPDPCGLTALSLSAMP